MAAETDSETDVEPEFEDELSAEDQASEPTEPESPEQTIARLEEQVLRSQADFQNMRRRSLTDLEAGVKRRMQPLLDELLLVLDFLDLALASPAEHQETKNLAMGVEMTRGKFVQALKDADVHAVAVDGVFDPNLHEAVEAIEDDSQTPGTILEVLRAGYRFGDHVLRPARVKVVAEADGGTPGGAGNGDGEES